MTSTLISLTEIQAQNSLMAASDAIGHIPRLSATAKSALLYLDGDYFQNWNAWVGAQVPPEAQNRTAMLAEIERSFTPRPISEEVTERQIVGIIGQEPSFEFVSTRSNRQDEKVLASYDKIKSIIKKREQATLPPANSLPPANEPDPEDKEQKAQLLADARAQLAIEDAMFEMLEGLGIDADDDFTLPDDVPPSWKTAVDKAKALKRELALEKEFISEINTAFGDWWDKRRGHELLHDFLHQLCATGRAALRFYIPWGLLTNGEVQAKTWIDALDKIYLEVPAVEKAITKTDPATMATVAIYSYSALGEDKATESRAEVTFLNDAGETVIRILNDEGTVEDEVAHDCAGELFVDVATAKPLLSSAVQRNQNALNVVNTMLLHNSNLAGHRERNYINLQRPQRPDPKDPSKKVDDVVRVGARSANFLTGLSYEDAEGKTHIAPGSIIITDPVDPKPLIEAMDAFEDNILGAASQMHTKISGDATASAVSRVQARYEHIKRLQGMGLKLEGVLRSRMVGIVALAMALSKDPADVTKLTAFKKLRPYVRCHLNAGPLTPDERRVILDEYQANIRSLESTQMLLGTEDVEGEMQKLTEEREGSLPQLQERAEVVSTLVTAGATVGGAARIAGFDEEDANLLESGFFQTEEPEEDEPKPEPPPEPANE